MAGALREILARFGVSFDAKELEKGSKAVDGVAAKLGKLATIAASALAGSAIVKGTADFVNAIAEQADQLGDLSERLGISTDALQEWGFAAQMSGAEAEDMSMAIVRLQAAAGSGSDALVELGVNAKDAAGQFKSADVLLEDVADRFEKITSPAERTNKAMKLFGKSGAKLVPLLSRGKKGIAELRKEFKELGGGFSTEAIEAAGKYKDSIERLNVTWNTFKARVGGFVLPLAEKFIGYAIRAGKVVGGWVDKLQPLIEKSNILKGVAVALGVALVAAFAPAVIAALPLIATLVAIALAVDELITTWQGGDTVIRRAIDNIFGEGSTKKAIDWVKGVIKSTEQLFTDTQGALTEFDAGLRLMWFDLTTWLGDAWADLGTGFELMLTNFVSNVEVAIASVKDMFGGLWNSINDGIEKVPGLGKLLGKLSDARRANTGNADAARSDADGKRAAILGESDARRAANEKQRQAIVDSSVVQRATAPVPGASTANVDQKVYVTVPPGTPERMARDVGAAVQRGMQPSMKGLQNQLVRTAG